MTCLASGFDDADEDLPSYSYAWFINSLEVSGATDETLDPLNTVKTDSVYCQITPGDGLDDGEAVPSDPILVANKPPTAPILGWSPGTPEVGQDLGCIVFVDSTDADGDPISYEYTWYLDYEEQLALAG